MIAVGNALRRWRTNETSLKCLSPDGAGLSCKLDTDLDAKIPSAIQSILSLSIGPTETTAVVPFTITETVSVAGGRPDLLRVVADGIERAFNGKCCLTDPEASIHLHRLSGPVKFELRDGLMLVAIFQWEGTASWFPTRSAS